MNSCEIASLVTAISCAIAKCVPKEEIPVIAAVFGQIASTLATITVLEAEEQPVETAPIASPDSRGIITQSLKNE